MADPFDGDHGLEEVAKGKGDASLRLAAVSDDEVSDLDRFLAGLDMNDDGNGQRLVKRCGEDLRYVRGRDWYGWNGLIWVGDEEGTGPEIAQQRAKETSRAIRREVRALYLREGKKSAKAGMLAQHAVQSGNVGRVNNMLTAAQPDLSFSLDDLNPDPFLFYCENKALQLFPSVKMVARRREDFVTKIARARFDQAASCPKWENFIEQIFPNAELRSFVQRALGYSLTADMSEEVFFLCWGQGRNGKGTLLRTVAHVLGDYAASIPIDLLLKKTAQQSGNEANPQFSALPAVRFVITTEPGPGVAFDEGLMQSLTGRDRFRIRDMYGKPFYLEPRFKMWIAVNDRPAVRGSSNAFWRRVKPIPFVTNITQEQTNPYLERELHEEASGIFNWLLDGLADWADRKGLAPPEMVAVATQSYRDEMDPLHLFLTDCVALDPGNAVAKKALGQAYEEWCLENGVEPMKPTALGRALTSKGYVRRHSNGTYYVDRMLTERGYVFVAKSDEKARRPTGF